MQTCLNWVGTNCSLFIELISYQSKGSSFISSSSSSSSSCSSSSSSSISGYPLNLDQQMMLIYRRRPRGTEANLAVT